MKPIACVSGVELLMEYLEGVVPPELRAALDEHVAGCPRCTAFVESYLAVPRILREATASTVPVHLEASLKAFLRARTDAFKEN